MTVTVGQPVVFAHEAARRQRIAVLGTSGHAFRNYLPVLPFVPVEYVAQWDPDRARARAFARQFGAGDAGYDDVATLLREQAPEAVWIATDELEADGRTVQPRLIAQCLAAGCHVFCDKPVASTSGRGAGADPAARARRAHGGRRRQDDALPHLLPGAGPARRPRGGVRRARLADRALPADPPRPRRSARTRTARARAASATSGTPSGRPCASAGPCAGCTSSPTTAGATGWSRGASAAGRWWASTSPAPSPASARWSTWRRSARGPTPWWRTPPG